jgi:hypothetical protein
MPNLDLPIIRPEPEDDRYDLRLKVSLARTCLKLSEEGMFGHAMIALYELGVGRTMPTEAKPKGTKIPNIDPRTSASALASFLRAMTALAARTPPDEDGAGHGVTAIDLVVRLQLEAGND